MTGQVIALNGGPTGQPEPNEACIKTLEDFLTMARSGQIVGIALAGRHHDGCASYASGGAIGGFSMLGALDLVHADVLAAARGDVT